MSLEDDEILELDLDFLKNFKDIMKTRLLKITNKEIVQIRPR